MKVLVSILIIAVIYLLAISHNQTQVEVIQPKPVSVPEYTIPTSPVHIEQPQPRLVMQERVYWQESPEYYHWRTSIKTSIEDSLPPQTSGRWVTEYYWSYK